MLFEWDPKKSIANKEKHGIDFKTAKRLWADDNRVEVHAPHPVEDRWILIGKKDNKIWTAIFALRDDTIRIISVRRSREKEEKLYDEKGTRKN